MADSAKKQIELILSKLEERGIPAAPVEEAITLGASNPEAVHELASAVMERFPKGGTFLDAALSFLPEDAWPDLVKQALNRLNESQGVNEAAASVIAYASLQMPSSLHAELERIFNVRPNSGSYHENYPWRESGGKDFAHLRSIVDSPSSPDDDRMRAWTAMLETRHLEVIKYAYSHCDAMYSAAQPGYSQDEWVQAHLQLVSFNIDNGSLNRLCGESLHHIRFPESFFDDVSRPPWLARVHPTWKLRSTGKTISFGGWSVSPCSLCGERLHRLLVLDPVPQSLGVTTMQRLEFATCLSCLGWEQQPLSYHHDEHGNPMNVGYDGPPVKPEFSVGPLIDAEVCLAETPQRWYWQDWGLSNSRENLNRIGGEPCWVQDAEYPSCPSCQRVMKFIIQLDSDLPTANGEEWLWGSGGIGYGFWCDDCKISSFLWQCT